LTGRSGHERGAATVEAVLIVPVLVLLIMTIIQFGLWYHADSLATAAAQDGARAARLPGATAADGQARAVALLEEAGPTIIQDRLVLADRNAVAVRVEVRGTCIALVPGVHLPVHAVAESSTERFVPAGARG